MNQASEAAPRLSNQPRDQESLAALAAGVAHDFNNLLLSVVGNASLARQLLPPGNPAEGLLDGILKAGEQAARLTRQMLACAGTGKFLVETIGFSELVSEAAEALRPSLPRIDFHLDLAPGLPPLRGDRVQLRQLFANLALNAAEATGPSGGVVSVRTALLHVDARNSSRRSSAAGLSAGPYVALEVSDRGCGMDAATEARIFDPFFSTKFTGRGLGLAAAAGIVRAHEGAILVATAPGQGSTFTVLLPVGK
jgi:signal transduction histidine kinase